MQRLHLLGKPLRLRTRDLALTVVATAIGTAAGAASVVDLLDEAPPIAPSHWLSLDDLRAAEANEADQADP